MNDVDRENERRRAIFDSGRAAKRNGRGQGANPHFDGLDSQIWRNGWNWEDDYPHGSSPVRFVVSILAILAALGFLLFILFAL
jgi:hypothetical protein